MQFANWYAATGPFGGVRCASSRSIEADLVIDATGRGHRGLANGLPAFDFPRQKKP